MYQEGLQHLTQALIRNFVHAISKIPNGRCVWRQSFQVIFDFFSPSGPAGNPLTGQMESNSNEAL